MEKTIPTLETLPGELLSNIAARLHVDDISSFRLVSRAVEEKSFHEFATEYFSEKCFMFTTESLKVLVEIAKSKRLREHLHHVHFMTAIFSNTAFNCPRGCSCSWQPSVKQKEAFRGYIQDQKMLKTTKLDKQMLSEAFASLPNVITLSLDDSPSILGPDVDYRGSNKVPRLCGRGPLLAPHAGREESFKEYDAFFRHTWEIIMHAIQHSTSIKRFGTHLSKSNNGVPIAWLDTAKFSQSVPAFKDLTALLLRIRSHKRAGCMDEKDRKDVTKREVTTLTNFARALPSLEVLDLAFDSTKATGAYLLAFLAGLDMSKLTTLYLDGVNITSAALVKVLHKATSVKDLRIIFTNLSKGSWVSVLKILQTMTDHLSHLHLMYLLEAGRKAYFLKQIDEDARFPEDEYDDGVHDSDFSDEDATDDDLPPLEPACGPATETTSTSLPADDATRQDTTSTETGAAESASAASANTASASTAPTTTVHDAPPPSLPTLAGATPSAGPATTSNPSGHSNIDHVRPGDFESGERGYFVCVQGDEIAAQLPTFIAEYNLGEDVDEAMGMPVGLGGAPPAFNNFMNILGAALGVPGAPPPPGGNGAAPAAVPGAAAFPVGGPMGGMTAIPLNIPTFPPPNGPAPPPPPAPSTNAGSNTSAAATGNGNGHAGHSISTDAVDSMFNFPWDAAAEDEWEDDEEGGVD